LIEIPVFEVKIPVFKKLFFQHFSKAGIFMFFYMHKNKNMYKKHNKINAKKPIK